MARLSLEPLRSLDGSIATALVDAESGMLLAQRWLRRQPGSRCCSRQCRSHAREAQSRQQSQVEATPSKTSSINLTKQYHIIRPLESNQKLFLYVVLDRSKANLAMARHELRTFEKGVDFS